MKRKLVVWGSNAQEEKVLLAIELLTAENQVKINVLPESIATSEVYKSLMDLWRVDQAYQIPEGGQSIIRDLTISGSMLPDELKVENGSLIQRAQTEWHFVVLSSKLHSTYKAELEDLKEKIEKLTEYDSASWEMLKAYWGKVSEQAKEKNLFWDHANELRDGTNELFSRLKEMRAVLDEEFRTQSKQFSEVFFEKLNEVEEKVKQNVNFGTLMNELKDLQKKYQNTKFTKEDRNAVWNRIDKAFKIVKEKKFGKEGVSGNSAGDRLKKRYDGLLNAIQKMERSIHRDEEELKFQNRRAEKTEGQLELQIRQAKMKMLEQRVLSKKEKLDDMKKTEKELAKKLAKIKSSEDKGAKKKEEAKPKADTPKDKAKAEAPKAAENIEKEASDIIGALGATLGESIGDVMDTAKAVAEVVGTKLSEAVSEIKEDLAEQHAKEEEE